MRSVLILAVIALALLVACAPAQPAAPAAPAAPAPVAPEPVEKPAREEVVETTPEPAEPADEEPDTLPSDKIVVTTEDLADSGKDCEDKAGSGTIDAQKDANACCTKKLGLPSVFTGGNCVPIS